MLFGDSAVAAYRSAVAALDAARSLRDAFAAHDWPGDRDVGVQVAISTGDVIATAHGHFGAAVNTAFALLKKARGADSRIVVSPATRGLLGSDEALRELDGGVFEVIDG